MASMWASDGMWWALLMPWGDTQASLPDELFMDDGGGDDDAMED